MNLTTIKSAATAAKADSLALDFWREDVSPDDVLRLVEVARAAKRASRLPTQSNLLLLVLALEGIEP